MAPGRRKHKPFDYDARKVPLKAKAAFVCSALASAGLCALTYHRFSKSQYEGTGLDVILHVVPMALAAVIPCSMIWSWNAIDGTTARRDELELHDGSIMGCVALLALVGQAAFSMRLGLEGAGAVLLAAAHLVLACRNSKGLRVAWLKQAIPRGRAQELVVGCGCGAAIVGVLTLGHIKEAYSVGTAVAMAGLYTSSCLSLLSATFATYSERWPKVNSEEMWQAAAVLGAAEACRGVHLAYAHRLQVAAGCLASVLFATGLLLAGVAAYRRTILRSKNTVV